jgi:hypothetical protein
MAVNLKPAMSYYHAAMMRSITVVLILLSAIASIYYSFGGVTKPEAALVYNKANMSRSGIQLLSLFLGIGGVLLLFPQTFKVGGAFLIIHSLVTIACFLIVRDWRGGFLELIFLQIPIFPVWAGYPMSVLEKLRNYFA